MSITNTTNEAVQAIQDAKSSMISYLSLPDTAIIELAKRIVAGYSPEKQAEYSRRFPDFFRNEKYSEAIPEDHIVITPKDHKTITLRSSFEK